MKIVIDTSPLGSLHKTRGIGTYTKCLVEALKRIDRDNEYILTSRPNLVDADLIHYPYFDLFFLTLPLIKKKPTVVTVHDVIPLIFPIEYKPGLRGSIKYRVQQYSLKSVAAIITDSDCSKKDIVERIGVSETRVHRVYLAAHEDFKPPNEQVGRQTLARYGLSKPYFLYVGDINFNKNIPGLLKSFAKLKSNHQLVIVTKALQQSSVQEKLIKKLMIDLKLTDKVTVLANVPSEPKIDLSAIYAGADWYIQPSLYEGFGLPVLEAFACGIPAIISTGGSLPEITPPGSINFDPFDRDSMVAAFEKALAVSSDKRQQLIREANNYRKQFSWDKTARETIGVYQQVLSTQR
jgi:glycosyltransferase involved in cell wall biosynthesis